MLHRRTSTTGLALLAVVFGACRSDAPKSLAPEPVEGRTAAEAPPRPAPVNHVPAVAPPVEAVDEGFETLVADGGGFEVAWRAVSGEVPRNREFELDVRVRRDGVLVGGATLAVRGWMPDHGHGTVREPIVTEVAPGEFRVVAMLFHMRGAWDLSFEVTKDGVTGTARTVVTL